ncbi:hypothetical protein ABZ307_16280 [Streptomyces griseorubiginosus]|uniref:hypothetical protein n=1 Tax=Streptomyces griseorubiginosus TaxID=67304 RepID=UPI0033B373CF
MNRRPVGLEFHGAVEESKSRTTPSPSTTRKASMIRRRREHGLLLALVDDVETEACEAYAFGPLH